MPGSDSVAYIQMRFRAMLLQHCHRASDSSKAQGECSPPTSSKAPEFKLMQLYPNRIWNFRLKNLVLKASVKTEPSRMAGISPLIFL